MFFQRSESYTIHIDVNGSLSLPDPGPINAFLWNLSGPLDEVSPPPVQLQLCKLSNLYASSLDFYTMQHPEGCESAPKGVKSKQWKTVRAFQAVCLIWTLALYVVVVLFAFVLICCRKSLEEWVNKLERKERFPKLLETFSTGERSFARTLHDIYVVVWYGLPLPLSLFVTLLYINKHNFAEAPPFWQLPEAETINQFLRINGDHTTLYLCTIRKLFQVYIGFADSCNQVQDWFYPEVQPKPTAFVQNAIMFVASVITFSMWTFLAMAAVYFIVSGFARCCEALDAQLREFWAKLDCFFPQAKGTQRR